MNDIEIDYQPEVWEQCFDTVKAKEWHYFKWNALWSAL
jgi:hypothetical protein